MHPSEPDGPGWPAGVSSHIQVQLRPGWSFDRSRRSFIAEDGTVVVLRGRLPAGTKIRPAVPSLAEADPVGLSEDERYLARSLQAVLPKGVDPGDVLSTFDQLEPVERASLPPRIGLP